MKFLLLFFLLCLISCNNQRPCLDDSKTLNKQQEAAVDCSASASTDKHLSDDFPADIVDVPGEANLFQANLSFSKFDPSDILKVERAVEIIKKVIQSQEFKNKVLEHSYKGKRGFVDSKLTNEEIYASLIAGMETLRPEVDHEMDLELELYYSSKNTVGYTYPGGLKIWMNTKYFDVFTPAQVAGNLFHEWTHKLGYNHAFKYTPSRDYSVPYALGYLIRDLGKKYE